jgi:hypothetical protein
MASAAIVEPARLRSAQEVADRVCAYVGCSHEPHLTNPDMAARLCSAQRAGQQRAADRVGGGGLRARERGGEQRRVADFIVDESRYP